MNTKGQFLNRKFSAPSFFQIALTGCCLLMATSSFGVTKTAVTNGEWGVASVWSPSGKPSSGDYVIIPSGIKVTATLTEYDLRGAGVTLIEVWGTLDFDFGGIRLDNGDGDKIEVMSGGTIRPTGAVYFGAEALPSVFVSNVGGTPVDGSISGPINVQNGALPIELLSFTGEPAERGVALNWSTASEKNFDFFQVERAVNGMDFQAIGKREGAGFSTEKRDYSFTDLEVSSGTYYYRLKNVDRDGTFSHSKIIYVNMESHNWVTLFPNPISANNSFHVNLNVTDEATRFVLFDRAGRPMLQTELLTGDNQLQLPGHVAPGVYVVKLVSGKNQQSMRVVVE